MGFAETNSPRYQLRFEELPRGFVPFPEHIVKGIAELAATYGYGAEYARNSLVRHTLVWYYDGLPVAYRECPDGIEVLALGWDETDKYDLAPEDGVKVVQP
jgi:hypothetical protein